MPTASGNGSVSDGFFPANKYKNLLVIDLLILNNYLCRVETLRIYNRLCEKAVSGV